jgi:methionine-R-sulfoxide reductase
MMGGRKVRTAAVVAAVAGLLGSSGACRAPEVASGPRELPAATGEAGPPAAPAAHADGWRKLTPQEEAVIAGKATERPFSGEYVHHQADGVYRCKRCGASLFASDAKFDSRSGWPSFDEALPGAVREVPDRDGSRVEIVCAQCGGHLGHVFTGEGFTDKDTRHCVNSASLDFSEAPPAK